MAQTTFNLKKPITLDTVKKIVVLEKEISAAVHLLGYNLVQHTLSVSATFFGRYKVLMDNKYFGIWDCRHKTFVD